LGIHEAVWRTKRQSSKRLDISRHGTVLTLRRYFKKFGCRKPKTSVAQRTISRKRAMSSRSKGNSKGKKKGQKTGSSGSQGRHHNNDQRNTHSLQNNEPPSYDSSNDSAEDAEDREGPSQDELYQGTNSYQMGFSNSNPLEQTTAAFGSMNFDPSNQQASPSYIHTNTRSLYSQNPSEGNFPTVYSQNTPYTSSPPSTPGPQYSSSINNSSPLFSDGTENDSTATYSSPPSTEVPSRYPYTSSPTGYTLPTNYSISRSTYPVLATQYSSPATRFASQQSQDQQPPGNTYLDSSYEKEPTSQQDPLYLPAPFECKCDLDPELCKVVLWPGPRNSKTKDGRSAKRPEVKSTSSRANTQV
jgi:hypothetical protein